MVLLELLRKALIINFAKLGTQPVTVEQLILAPHRGGKRRGVMGLDEERGPKKETEGLITAA